MFCGKKVFLDSEIPIFCTASIVEVDGKAYQEFVERIPSPDHLRYHYFSRKNSDIDKNNKIISESNFSEVKYHPTLLNSQIRLLTIKALKQKVRQKSSI